MNAVITAFRKKTYAFLRWSEQYTRTDMVYLTKGGFWLLVGYGISLGSSIVLAIGFANLLPQEAYGTYKFALSLAGIFTALSLTGLPTALVRSVAQGFEGTFRKSFVLNIRWSALVFVLGLVSGLYYFFQGNTMLALSVFLVSSCSPFLTSASLYNSFLEGRREFRMQTFYSVARNLVPAMSLLVTIFFTDSVLVVVSVYLASNALVAFWLYRRTMKQYKPNKEEDPATVPYSKHLSAMNIIATVAANVDKVLVFHFLGAVPLAIYSFAQAPVSQLENPSKFVSRLAFPKLSERNLEALKATLPRKVFLLFGVMAIVVVAYWVAAPYLFQYLFPQYIDSVPFTRVYALTLLFAPATLFGQTLTAHMKTKALYISRIITPGITIILFLVLLPLYGLWGAIMTLVVTQIIHFVFAVYFFYTS